MIYPAKNDGSHLHARGCRFARSMFSSVLSVPKPELCLAKTFPVAALGGGKKLMVQVKKEKKSTWMARKRLGYFAVFRKTVPSSSSETFHSSENWMLQCPKKRKIVTQFLVFRWALKT